MGKSGYNPTFIVVFHSMYNLTQPKDHGITVSNFIFPINYVIPKSLTGLAIGWVSTWFWGPIFIGTDPMT